MPFGYLLDLWECHKQFTGISKPRRELFIDDIIPAEFKTALAGGRRWYPWRTILA